MKKVLLILACGIAAQLSYAQATPKWAGKAKKAVFSIVTYDKDNKIKNTGNGFYINENGTALSNEKTVSCPIMNANGEVLGLIQKNASDEAKESYAIGATYGASLSITALSLNDMSLNKIGIKKGLPETEDQALVYLFMASSQQNQDEYITTLNDFLEQYPNSADGYIRRATTYMGFNDDEHNALADADLKKALEVTTNKSETQYNIAKLIYSYIISLGDKKPYGDWSYDKALSIIHDAMQADNQPIYTQLEGDILFAMGTYMGFNDDEHNWQMPT